MCMKNLILLDIFFGFAGWFSYSDVQWALLEATKLGDFYYEWMGCQSINLEQKGFYIFNYFDRKILKKLLHFSGKWKGFLLLTAILLFDLPPFLFFQVFNWWNVTVFFIVIVVPRFSSLLTNDFL